ncbi:hypothetical protein KSF_102140 [Reticulibacter mediterranei]|uniref:Uncharacterized protein n=1 Tax=Reticulibacter mediterranei TaxID=2778369 RepID=A0A8J3ISV2_9CHLR|nr:hypothetical protein KSF_102140 [Reticulibacter mediterranei]
MFSEILSLIDFPEAATPESAQQAIVADLLTAPILREDHLLGTDSYEWLLIFKVFIATKLAFSHWKIHLRS